MNTEFYLVWYYDREYLPGNGWKLLTVVEGNEAVAEILFDTDYKTVLIERVTFDEPTFASN